MNNTKNIYHEFYEEIKKAGLSFVDSVDSVSPLPKSNNIKNIFICGMGGSGISGNYIQILNKTKINIILNKKYFLGNLPDDSLAIVISYSGNTEETISMLKELLNHNIKPHIISSGGKMAIIAKDNFLPFYQLPQGLQPRVAFPYILGKLYGLTQNLLELPIITSELKNRIISSSEFIFNEEKQAKLNNYSKLFLNKMPIILSSDLTSAVGLRFRCQLNENSKLTAMNYELPEFSHNGIVGFDGIQKLDRLLVLVPSKFQSSRVGLHFDYYEVFDKKLDTQVIRFDNNTSSILEEMLILTWGFDYISVRVAELQNISPLDVPSIVKLKAILKSNQNSLDE